MRQRSLCRSGNNDVILKVCQDKQVINILSAKVGYNPQLYHDADPPTCAWKNAWCQQQVSRDPAITRCNGTNSCSISGEIFSPCTLSKRRNIINIRYYCLAGT